MSTKAAFLRENITIDQVSMQWTCNQCFKDRLGTPGLEKKPLKAYAYTGTSNVSRHFEELHKEQLAEAMVRIGQSKLERRKGMGKREYLKRPRPVKRQKLEDVRLPFSLSLPFPDSHCSNRSLTLLLYPYRVW